MHITEMVPKVPITSFKRTKIIATIGPSTDSYEAIYEIIDEGANGLRLNFSHGTYEERLVQIPWIRKASGEIGKPVAIVQDLQGPKVRLGDFDGEIHVETGQELVFEYKANYVESGHVPTQYDLSEKIKPEERLFLFDGKVKTTVTRVEGKLVYARANNSGVLLKRKGMNLPDTDFGGDILTEKDMADIEFGAKQDIDYVALSFVQKATDVTNLRSILEKLGSEAKIIAKIETKAAVDNIEEIVHAADAIMVARGDLAVETPAEAVPVVQRHIIGLGHKFAKPTIVATQMLMSMVDSPHPSRAEVSDVATAVFLGADCVMLSDETANGKYPTEAVKMMKSVILHSELHPSIGMHHPYGHSTSMRHAIASGALSMAEEIGAQAIVAETKSGATALEISSLRPSIPTIAVTNEDRTAQQLAIVYDVKSYVRPVDGNAALRLAEWLRQKEVLAEGDVVVMVSGRYPGVAGVTDTIKVRVLE